MNEMEPLSDGEITLRLSKDIPADTTKEWLRALHFDITLPGTAEAIGFIDIRLGYTLSLVRFGGHFGYNVKPKWRGRHYAGKACKLLRRIAIIYGMDVLWITCNPENWPSRKTCEWIGATLIEIVDLPPENEQYKEGDRKKCRYRWILY
jgi:predicted acetyltransferase